MLDSERTCKNKGWTVFVVFLTSAVVCIEKIVQYLQNYKRHEVDLGHSKKIL